MAEPGLYERVANRAMTDVDFKEKLLKDPKGTLVGEGFDFPEGVSVQVVFDTASTMHFVLPFDHTDGGDRFIIC